MVLPVAELRQVHQQEAQTPIFCSSQEGLREPEGHRSSQALWFEQ